MSDAHENIVEFDEVDGGWTLNYPLYYEHAWCLIEKYHEQCLEIIDQENQLRKKFDVDKDEPHFDDFIFHRTLNMREDLELMYTSCVLYSCMAIEGFFNFYGVKRLGEKNYKTNLERIGITEKFSVLIMICFGIKTEKSDPVSVSYTHLTLPTTPYV